MGSQSHSSREPMYRRIAFLFSHTRNGFDPRLIVACY